MVAMRTPGSRPLRRSWGPASIALIAALLVAVVGPNALADSPPELTEFSLPVPGSSPFGITTGPDGALWFTERGTDSIGSLDPDGTFSPSTSLAPAADPTAITTGPDGNVWFTEQGAGSIGRIGSDGTLSEFSVPTDVSGPAGITTGPDGALWFTERSGHKIGRITTDGAIAEFPLLTSVAGPVGIVTGPDGNLWFTEQRANKIGRITTDGSVTEFPVPIATSLPTGIAAGSDGALWFTMRAANRIGRIDTAGTVTTFPIPTAATDPTGIAAGWDGALWFTEPDIDAVGRITTDGDISERSLPNVGSSPFGITGGPDEAVWFTEGNGNRIGRLGVPLGPVDTTPPAITITTPPDGAVYLTGAQVPADYGCVDEPGGSDVAACDGPVANGSPIDTSLGAHRFDVVASDQSGNTATASTGYVVFSDLSGSLVSGGMERPGNWTTVALGMADSLATKDVSLVVAAGYPLTQQVSCSDPSQTLGPAESANTMLQVKQGGLTVRWRTDHSWVDTCRTLTFRFVASGWTGADAVFVARFDAPGGPGAKHRRHVAGW
jgi:virginiamycin B lyase